MSLRSIARELGVSSTSVSLALKNSPRVSEDLRSKIIRLAEKQGYVPNARLSELRAELRKTGPRVSRATLGLVSLYPEKTPGRSRPHLRAVMAGAKKAARRHGFRLESFWIKEPGMTPARLAGILQVRGIQGLMCLGGNDPDEPFPIELQDDVVVTLAPTTPGKLHRVCRHFTADTDLVTDQLCSRGYKKPGLVILETDDQLSGHSYSSVFLGWQDRRIRPPHTPILRFESWDEQLFDDWFSAHQPDAIILQQLPNFISSLEGYLEERNIRVPEDLGLALLEMHPNFDHYSGIRQNYTLLGATAVEILINRIILNDFGIPDRPKVELVAGTWNDGKTLRD
jgi:DNA-binding LacI/PurR family transcriptional regulator